MIMKRILTFIALVTMSYTLLAQTKTGNKFVDVMMTGRSEYISAGLQRMQKRGIDSQVDFYYDTAAKAFVWSYQVQLPSGSPDEVIANITSDTFLQSLKREELQAIIADLTYGDPDGIYLEAYVQQLKKSGSGFRWELFYTGSAGLQQSVSVAATPGEVQRLSSMIY